MIIAKYLSHNNQMLKYIKQALYNFEKTKIAFEHH